MNQISHFSVSADNLERAMEFYQKVFGWTFEAWGPPGFFMIQTGQAVGAIHGDIHQRETPLSGDGIRGFECTISVADVDEIARKVTDHGGTVVFQKSVIHGVGELIRFQDPEGNFACAMKYETGD